MAGVLAAAILAAQVPATATAAAGEEDTVLIGKDGQLFLRQEVVLDTDVASVWALWTTAEGVRSWIAPVAEVDLRPGGAMRSHYDADAKIGDPGTIETRIVNYIPQRLLTLQADLEPVEADWLTDAIRVEAANLYNVVSFEPLGSHRTRIVSWGIGYRDTPEWQPMISFFTRANRWTFGELEKAVARARPETAAVEDRLAPLRFLAGKCWRGTFGDGPAYDVLCADDMAGGHLRTRHLVRGVDTDYRGETIYHFDGEAQAIGFTYYASSGGVTEGLTSLEDDGSLRFLEARYQYPDGRFHRVRGRTMRLADGTFRTESAMMREGEWEEQPILDMRPIACADWDAVEKGCD
ncbi:SRPBCC family protein [Sphingomicrobium nitratireducens]|uniref:SRPBCC family protein n=1 Tax=Sphingomicrobium nitratireducens TaxID=2964666 RepID=UPI00223F3A8B|nr:SRPBCC domain-containing protein [Sphingomicrobium nitratireducens]